MQFALVTKAYLEASCTECNNEMLLVKEFGVTTLSVPEIAVMLQFCSSCQCINFIISLSQTQQEKSYLFVQLCINETLLVCRANDIYHFYIRI